MKASLLFLTQFLFYGIISAQQTPAYYRYEGKLGPREAVMEIAIRPQETTEAEQEIEPITAYYYFKDDGIPMLLYKSKDSVGTGLVLRSWSDEVEERFVVHYNENSLAGRWYWTAADEGEAIALKATKISKKDGFIFFRDYKIIEEELNESDPPIQGTISFSAFLPADPAVQQSFIKQLTDNHYNAIKPYTESEITSFEKSYKEALKDFLANGDAEYTASMNQFSVHNLYPIMNSDSYIIMLHSVYSYSGGAHGMNTDLYYNYDKKTKKWLALDDVFDLTKKANIEKVLDKELRAQYTIPEGVKLSEAKESDFIADEIPLTDNFTLSRYHITFHYQPYQLTPYAAGPFELKVPLKNFTGMLKAGFIAE